MGLFTLRLWLIIAVGGWLTILLTGVTGSTSLQDEARFELGKKLFYDPILSSDSSLSCASCHKQQFAFSDTVRYNRGVDGALQPRNSMSLVNLQDDPFFFWDGRAATLDQQIVVPITAKHEMGQQFSRLVFRINRQPIYVRGFQSAFGALADSARIIMALKSFVEQLESHHTAAEQRLRILDSVSGRNEAYVRTEFYKAFSPKVYRVLNLCESCHLGSDYGGVLLRNNGLPQSGPGYAQTSGKDSDYGKFKVPTLRNIAVTGPYMHDGRFRTLKQVIEYYNGGIRYAVNLDTLLQENGKPLRLGLSRDEIESVVQFLNQLTDSSFLSNPRFSRPKD